MSGRGSVSREVKYGDLRTGVCVIYSVQGLPFRLAAHRLGVEWRGAVPPIPAAGVEAIMEIFSRALAHHLHLKSIPVGEPQTVLDEAIFDAPPVDTPKVGDDSVLRPPDLPDVHVRPV